MTGDRVLCNGVAFQIPWFVLVMGYLPYIPVPGEDACRRRCGEIVKWNVTKKEGDCHL